LNPENPSNAAAADPPGSSFSGPVQELITQGVLTAPPHLGVLAQLDEFEILQLIGRGGMGVVFLARDSRSNQQVAIKLMRPDLAADPELTQRFIREAKRLQGLNHPHLLPVLEIRERARGPYFVMPCFDQGSLRTLLAERKPLPRERILEIAGQLAEALRFLHKTPGLIHRDVKPENVLLDENGSVRLADLGLARSVTNDSFLSLDKTRLEGTAPYMSPAVAAGEEEDTRYDVYSFGALLYELLTGQPPYRGGDAKAILDQVKAGPPPAILRVNPQADKSLARVAEKAMARTLRERYAEMADVCADLERIRSGGSATHRGARQGILVAGIVLLLAFAGVWFARSLRPYQLKTVRSIPANDVSAHMHYVEPGDWDGDGRTDLVFCEPRQVRAILNHGLLTPQHVAFSIPDGPLVLRLLQDVNNDNLPEALVSWWVLDPEHRRSVAHIAAVDRFSHLLKRFSFEGGFSETGEFGQEGTLLLARKAADLDRDGRPELLAEVTSGRPRRPRGLCCFDLQTGQQKWFFETAPFASRVAVQDVDGDGLDEVLLGSDSPNNGAAVTNALSLHEVTWDTNSFFYLLSHDGKLRWQKQLGGPYSSARPLPTADTAPSVEGVWVFVWCNPFYEKDSGESIESTISHFDSDGKLLAQYSPGLQLQSALRLDLDGDKRSEVVAVDREGFLHVLDHELQSTRPKMLLMSNVSSYVEAEIIGASDLARPPGRELVIRMAQVLVESDTYHPGDEPLSVPVITRRNETLLVLSSRLEVLARRVISERITDGTIIRPRCFLLPSSDPEPILVVRDPIEFIKLEQ